jgi:hypothetical protein
VLLVNKASAVPENREYALSGEAWVWIFFFISGSSG